MDVSICIATSRRHGLVQLLDSIARLKIPHGIAVEVVIVENSSEPLTEMARSELTSRLELPIRWLFEPRRNLSHVRNRSIECAAGHWLAFVDDDEVVREDWLAAYLEMTQHCECDGLFGPVIPRLKPSGNTWIDASFFARRRFETGAIAGSQAARTCNAFIRRRCFDAVTFDPVYGRSGGEDWDLFRRLIARGAHFLWCDAACVEEHVGVERQTVRWLTWRRYLGGAIYARSGGRSGSSLAGTIHGLRTLLGMILYGATVPIALLGGRRPAMHAWLRACVQAGKLFGSSHIEQTRGAD